MDIRGDERQWKDGRASDTGPGRARAWLGRTTVEERRWKKTGFPTDTLLQDSCNRQVSKRWESLKLEAMKAFETWDQYTGRRLFKKDKKESHHSCLPNWPSSLCTASRGFSIWGTAVCQAGARTWGDHKEELEAHRRAEQSCQGPVVTHEGRMRAILAGRGDFQGRPQRCGDA